MKISTTRPKDRNQYYLESMKALYRYSAFVLGLIVGLFLLILSLDAFPVTATWKEIEGFIIHSAPALLVILASFLGFYKPKYGFYAFLIITVAFTFYFRTYINIQDFMVISFPPFIIAMLLYLSSWKKKKI